MFARLKEDIDSFIKRDPAARSRWEVAFLYPGFHALLLYRFSHAFWDRDYRFFGRFVSQIGRLLTGIEIHPGAIIGARLFIDHGEGVVIGETSNIGDDVTLYQAVTLGGTSPSVDSHSQVDKKRHPTLEDGVIVGSGAQVLGPVTIAKNARIGANAVVTSDVPQGVTAVGIPARVVMPRDKKHAGDFVAYGTPVDGCPDPVLNTIESLRSQVTTLMARIDELESPKKRSSKRAPKTKKVANQIGKK